MSFERTQLAAQRARVRQATFFGFLVLALSVGWSTSYAGSADDDLFLQWAKGSLVPLRTVKAGPPWEDLSPLADMVGTSRVVALSEGVHAGDEPLQFRNRVFQYLVEKKGFTAIAIESGIVEGRTVHDYVRGGPGELATALRQGISWTFDQLPQNADLVRWIRDYNADGRHRAKINFYGFDVPGSPGNPDANRGMETALAEALAYLARVDSAAAAAIHVRIDPFLPSIRLDTRPSYDGPGYEKLAQADRNAVTAAIADLITLMERSETAYTQASSARDYRWAYRYAIGARQADNWLRRVPVGWTKSMEKMEFFSEATDIRDRAQADNLDWILNEEGPRGKILVYAARYHLSGAPVDAWSSLGSRYQIQQVAGTYLRRRLGGQLLTIGNLIGKGNIGCAGFNMSLDSSPPDATDALAGELGHPLFLLDLRKAPAGLSNWLNQPRQFGPTSGALKMPVGRAFDVLFYLNIVTPACK